MFFGSQALSLRGGRGLKVLLKKAGFGPQSDGSLTV